MSNTENKEVPFPSLSAATVRVLADLFGKASDARREELGLQKGTFSLNELVTVHAHGTLTVGDANPNAKVPQVAKPWNIIHLLLTELNTERKALGKAGIDIEKIVEMAEAVDPKLATEAKKAADARVQALKDPHRRFKWGSVSSKKAEVEVLGAVDVAAKVAEAKEGAA